jgi:hypothetical protein
MAFILRFFLILIVMAGSVVMAPSRGQMAGSSQVEICWDGGTRTLTLDARGNPVGPHPLCPDCIACVTGGPLPEISNVLSGAVVLPLTFPMPRPAAAARIAAIHPTARGPPLSA